MQPITSVARGEARDYPVFPVSYRQDFKLKDHNGRNTAAGWKTANMSALDLATHVSQGFAVAVSQYKGNYRNQSNAHTTRVLGLDFDDKGTPFTAEMAAEHPIIGKIAAVVMPTASDTPDAPRCRALCFTDRHVDRGDLERLKAVFIALLGEYDLDGKTFDNARMFYGSQPDPRRVFVAPHNVLRVDDFLATYANLAPAISGGGKSKRAGAAPRDTAADVRQAVITLVSNGGLERMLVNFEPQAFTGKDATTLDKLQYVMRLWELTARVDYAVWLAMWMSAYRASNGSENVLQYILAQETVWQAYTDAAKIEFEHQWAGLGERDKRAYTKRTLDMLARLCGWGLHNPYGALDGADKILNVVELSDGLDLSEIVPGSNLIIKSQTGSGKTKALLSLLQTMEPHEALVVSPYINLCYSVTGGLRKGGIDAVCYDERADTRGKLVVRTPQNTVSQVHDPSKLKLVFVEEGHAGLTHIAQQDSHMSAQEKRGWRDWLTAALRSDTCTVVLVDADFTNVSVQYLREIAAPKPVYVVHNTGRRKKADVTVTSQHRAFDRAIEVLRTGGRVVVPASTVRECDLAYKALSPYAKNAVKIMSKTKKEAGIEQFRADVERGAAETQLVIYNAAMGTGVSIETVTPDLIVQQVSYLTPRDWRQHLNRYRRQSEVLLVFNQNKMPRSQRRSAEQIYADIRQKYEVETELIGGAVNKDATATAYDRLVVGLEADKDAQLVSPLVYYGKLLQEDGRKLRLDDANLDAAHPSIQAARELIEAENQYVYDHFLDDDVEPIYSTLDAPDGTGEAEMALGLLRGRVERATYGYIPTDREPRQIAATVVSLDRTVRDIEAAITNESGLETTAAIVLDPKAGFTELRPKATRRTMLQICGTMLPDGLFTVITPELMAERAVMFVEQVQQQHEAYNAIVSRPHQKWDAVENKADGDLHVQARWLLTHILATVGLTLRQDRSGKTGRKGAHSYNYVISNAQQAADLMLWRGRGRQAKFGGIDVSEVKVVFGHDLLERNEPDLITKLASSPRNLARLQEGIQLGYARWDLLLYAVEGETPF